MLELSVDKVIYQPPIRRLNRLSVVSTAGYR